MTSRSGRQFQYDVALSFAVEDRLVVEEMAANLLLCL
jgi:hypothetical protein